MVVGNEDMSARGTRIWILITDGMNSRLCSCHDGIATPVTTPLFDVHGTSFDGRDVRAYKAWFKAESHRSLSPSPRRQHVLHLSQLLLESARERAYDGLVIIADSSIATEIEDALAPETRALLIGNIIRDRIGPAPDVLCEQPDIHH
jgi:hypothetical protein